MTDFTEETKTQAPHWKSEDITTRGVTAGKIAGLTSGGLNKAIHGEIADAIHGSLDAEVVRLDMENAYGDKPTIDHTEESKSTIDWSEESK